MRDTSTPWVLILAVVVAWVVADRPTPLEDGISWATGEDGAMGFGGWWVAYFLRPVFTALVLSWLWRILLLAY